MPHSPLTRGGTTAPPAVHDAQSWDVFCHVIDNHGDLGVCWRLCRQLAQRGIRVRLWCDDPSALAWMAPHGAEGVTVLPWRAPRMEERPGDVVVEAFGCDPPAQFIAQMAGMTPPPCWINLEYLSAEAYVERCHGLPSPQLAGPGRGLTKWFYYPGFTHHTGGLMHEPAGPPGRAARTAAGEAPMHRWMRGETGDALLISCFTYHARGLPVLLAAMPKSPVEVLMCPGPAQADAAACAWPGPNLAARRRTTALPWLTQDEYDDLLHACDLNLVRGEDSFVRAQWAGRPFLWQVYPQGDGAHAAKLEAFLALFLARADAPLAQSIRHWHRFWNGLCADAPAMLPPLDAWQAHCLRWRQALCRQTDLVSSLLGFVASRR